MLFLPDPECTFDFLTQRRTINIKRAHDFVPEAETWIDAEEQLSRYMADKVSVADETILSVAAMRIVTRWTESKSDLIAALARRTGRMIHVSAAVAASSRLAVIP